MSGGSCELFPSLGGQELSAEKVKEIEDAAKYISSELGRAEILAQLAEEAAELAQAALKYRRTLLRTNPTPVTREEALRNLREEIADVNLCIIMCDIPRYGEADDMLEKQERWARRIKEREGGR